MSEEQNKRDHCAEVQGSPYLIACDDQERERRKEWLYEILGPVFFGEKEAADTEEAETAVSGKVRDRCTA